MPGDDHQHTGWLGQTTVSTQGHLAWLSMVGEGFAHCPAIRSRISCVYGSMA